MNTIDPNTLSASEAYRINGTLPPSCIESLLDLEQVAENASNADTHVYEALIQFPDEDFLSDIIWKLDEFALRLRGKNREDLKNLAIQLQDIELSTGRSSEYGQAELTKARALLP